MSRFNLFIFCQLLNFSLMASEAEWSLKSIPHRSETSIHSISLDKGKIVVDGRKLTDVEVQVKFMLLNPLLAKHKSFSKKCNKGQYELTSIIKSKKNIETGCLESDRYSDILNSFDGLKKEEILK